MKKTSKKKAVKKKSKKDINKTAKGTRVEYQVRDILEPLGYVVTRSAASKGPFDLIAMHPTHTRLIQAKANRRPPKEEIQELLDFKAPATTSKEIWVRKDRVKTPIVEVL